MKRVFLFALLLLSFSGTYADDQEQRLRAQEDRIKELEAHTPPEKTSSSYIRGHSWWLLHIHSRWQEKICGS